MHLSEWARYSLNLELSQDERWSKSFQDDFSVIHASFRKLEERLGATSLFSLHGDLLGFLGLWFFGNVYKDEFYDLAQIGGISLGRIAILNWRYELDQYCELFKDTRGSAGHYGFRSSVLAQRLEDGKIMVIRAMDAPEQLCTYQVSLVRNGDTIAEIIVFPGIVGAWTGIRKGKYGICLSPEPALTFLPNPFRITPPSALRRVLEECDTYSKAVETLINTRMSTSAAFILWTDTECCVVEKRIGNRITEMKGDYLLLDNNGLNHKYMRSPPENHPDIIEDIHGLKYQIKALMDINSIRKM
jgi:hypothetical protein